MVSFKANGQEERPERRRDRSSTRRRRVLNVEAMEGRVLLTANPVWKPSSTDLGDVQNGPMANLGGNLIRVYQAYQAAHGDASRLPGQFPYLQFKGSSVLIGLTAYTNYGAFEQQVRNLGMQVLNSSAFYGLIEGWMPISQLPAAAQLPDVLSGRPVYKPITNQAGIAINQAEFSTFANVARQQFGLTGSGVTVGILSDSFDNLGSYVQDINTGDLPSGINILEDLPSGGSDEGRAMAQNVHKIAPGANLAFATAFTGLLGFADNIRDLFNQAGARVIVDDVSYSNDPFFQPGLVSQAIDQITAQGGVYFSSAANQAQAGYLSNFRGSLGTVTGVGTGRFMDFDPSAGVSLTLPMRTLVDNQRISFQFDQPFTTQQPAGSTNLVTSQLNFYVLTADGTIVASGVDDNTATQEPLQFLTVPTAGEYFVAIQVVKGPDPGRVQFVQFGAPALVSTPTISQQFGSAGGTFYATSFGHNSGANTIGVGAVPWWAPAPYLGQSPLRSEPFSSFGPQIQVRDAAGNLLSQPRQVQNPIITAPDGGNTTFFGQVANTANPPFPGQPATPFNLYATFTPDQSGLPSFFGTSSAAPNAAAVAALMLQRQPQATSAQIREALVASTQPMNATPQGTWDPQAGFGLINAVRAINAVDLLRVAATDPANGSTVTVTPSAITVTFNKPVVFSSVTSGNLVFTSAPAGVSVQVGTPIALDDPQFPTRVAFPFTFSFTNPPTTTANGTYTFVVQGNIVSRDGKTLEPSNPVTFNLNDVTAPRVTGTSLFSRVVTIQFDKAMNPATINKANVYVLRAGGPSVPWGDPRNVNLNSDPRSVLTYDPISNTATLDYSLLPQTLMPTDRYAIFVISPNPNVPGSPGATDLVGNPLDGNFTGSFPSGDNTAGGNFIQDLGLQTLSAPTLTSFQIIPGSDTGIPGDQNTRVSQPTFVGQVFSAFPGTVANLEVLIQFNGLHPEFNGGFDLGVGGGGRGFTGSFDVRVTTDSNGRFLITPANYPGGQPLPEGFQRAKVVVIGQPDQPPLPGFASQQLRAFRIDKTAPAITGASLTLGGAALPNPGQPGSPTPVSQLETLSLYAVDFSVPSSSYLATPAQFRFSAIDPASAANVSNYSLILNPGPNQVDLSSFITSARFVELDPIFDASNTVIVAFQGRIDLTFSSGLPAGTYVFTAHTSEGPYPGLRDAAGNPLDSSSVQGTPSFSLVFDVQSQPAYILNLSMQSSFNPDGSTTIGGPRSFYEIPSTDPAYVPRAAAPPTAWVVDLSNPIPFANYSNALQLIRSANNVAAIPDGEFGTLGVAGLGSTGTGFTRMTNVTVTLYAYNTTTQTWAPVTTPGGIGTRLVMTLNPGETLPADTYRIYMPNQVMPGGIDARIFDIYGNQFDGEFLGNPTAAGNYETLLPTGHHRLGLSGDTVGGGAFMTGFVVVPTGNIIYARPDYEEDPLVPETAPDGSLAKPYSTLAPEGDPARAPANPTNDPNGGLNDSRFFLAGFNRNYDRNGNRRFDRSAFYAASQLSFRGPVVIVALPGTPQRDPLTGQISQQTFVLQAPAGSNPVINDGSGSVPFNTTLVFNPGSTLKLQNASLFAQNQGSAIQAVGNASANGRVTFTSYANDAIAGDTNRDGTNTPPRPGDWGGIVLRNINNTGARNFQFPVDGTLVGPAGGRPVSGADDALSIFNFVNLTYAGGAVPATTGTRYDGITLFNSRPAITNTNIAFVGGASSAQAGISGDLDSFREDDLTRGPLIRRTVISSSSINGIWVRPELTGQAQQTNAINYPDNPSPLGGGRNFTFDDPLPHVLTSRLNIGQALDRDTNNAGITTSGRLYLQPGMIVKAQRGAGIALTSTDSSINSGDRTYIAQFDAGLDDPTLPGFRPNTLGDAKVLFTSLADDAATTFYFDPVTQIRTTIVPPIDSDNNGPVNQPQPGNVPDLARWGSVSIVPGARAVIDESEFRYGGGFVNVPAGTLASQNVLSFVPAGGAATVFFATPGTYASVTNNDFFDNLDAPLAITPNGLLAGDPLRPLRSGNPFFRGNVLLRNDINGLAVIALRSYADGGPVELAFDENADTGFTLGVNSVWDDTDLTHVVRGTIILAGRSAGFEFGGLFEERPLPSATTFGPSLQPAITLTIQSALPDKLLANGERIARPGESLVAKFLNDPLNTLLQPPGDNVDGSTGAPSDVRGGAGFIVGVDDGVDPDTAPLLGTGMDSQIRIVGIAANETTGQDRVPVIFTSLLDSSIPRTVRGVDQSQTYPRPIPRYVPFLGNRTTPLPGDGGLIYFGGKSLSDPNLFDPRDGNIIDNADIRYMTRVEVQGGGVVDVFNTNPGDGDGQDDTFDIDDNPRGQKIGHGLFTTGLGVPFNTALNQYNSAMAMTISNSNFANMSSAGILAHPGPATGLARNVGPTLGSGDTAIPTGSVFRSDFAGTQVNLFVYGNTFSNMPVGVRMNAETGNDDSQQDAGFLVLMNNTFFNVDVGLHTQAPEFAGGPPPNTYSNVVWVAMNNIFVNSSDVAIRFVGQQYNTQGQYNLFWNNNQNLDDQELTTFGFGGNNGPVIGDPRFRDPVNGDFRLSPGSAAIDASRSELGPLLVGNMLQPITNQVLGTDGVGGIRNRTGRLGFSAQFFSFPPISGTIAPSDIVSLPGFQLRTFEDQWVAALPGSPDAFNGTGANAGTFWYTPIQGERDQNGFLRIDDPSTPNIGFGSRPFFDIGAFEYRELFPPRVIDVTATIPASNGPRTIDFYAEGGIAGSNVTPLTINIAFNNLIDPLTINDRTVLLQGSGGDGIFGNGNNADDRFYNLSGRLDFDDATRTLRISLGAAGTTLRTDRYRIILRGTGSEVLRDPQGNPLDGENTEGALPDGIQLPLPSGNGFPGGNFYTTFLINTTPPELVNGTFRLAPSSDTNIIGDSVTTSTLPSFQGRIASPNPTLIPVQGQTALVDIGIAVRNSNGTTTVYFDPATAPAELRPFIRPNAGSGVTDAQGNFTVSIGVDAAGTGLVVNTDPLPESPFDVGPSGRLVPLPGTVSGYSVARARAVDQSGNQSDPNAPGATVPFVVDTTSPTVVVTSPGNNTVIGSTTGPLAFTVETNENLDLTRFTPAQIVLLKSADNGSFTGPGVTTIPINPNITAVYLDAAANGGSGGKGRMRITFTTQNALANGLYRLTLVTTGGNAIRDIAGNNPVSGDIVVEFAVFDPNNVTGVFVGGPSYVTDATLPRGDRRNPFPTINEALQNAAVGNRIQVLPGVYTERLNLLPFISIVSADPASTNATYIPGNALDTIVRAPATSAGTLNVTITAAGLTTFTNPTTGFVFRTEIGGLTIASPLVGDPALGPINESAIALNVINSDILINRNYIIDAGIGIYVTTIGDGSIAPLVINNGIIGNIHGMVVSDGGDTNPATTINIINNTFAFNTNGLVAFNSAATGSRQAYVANNIFWQNHSPDLIRSGFGVISSNPDKLVLNNNMFSGNGPSDTTAVGAAVNIGNGFDRALLGPTAADAAANLGNFVGYPSFVAPRDPRPGRDGPATFLRDANFGLTSTSAAINNALAAVAPTTDFLGNQQNPNPINRGLGLPGFGPRDVGAFEFVPIGTVGARAVGGEFRVVSTSLVPDQGTKANGATFYASPAPTSVLVSFSRPVDPATVQATDLVLSGTAIDPLRPAKAVGVSWINAHTARFELSGQFNTIGTLGVSLGQNSVKSTGGAGVIGYADQVVLNTQPQVVIPIAPPVSPAPTPAPTPTAPETPPPAAAPTNPSGRARRPARPQRRFLPPRRRMPVFPVQAPIRRPNP